MLPSISVIAAQGVWESPEDSMKCYMQPTQEYRTGMIKVFVFLRKPATSHPLPFINISQRNVSSEFFPKHSVTLESWKHAWKVEFISDVRGLLPPEILDLLVHTMPLHC